VTSPSRPALKKGAQSGIAALHESAPGRLLQQYIGPLLPKTLGAACPHVVKADAGALTDLLGQLPKLA
jgi:hypothetical protein